MNIYDAIETCSVYLDELDQVQKTQVISSYSVEEWIRATKFFLKGIGSRHNVSGEIVWTMISIADQYSRTGELSNKQIHYLGNNLINEWVNLTIEARSIVL